MSVDRVRAYLKQYGLAERVREFATPTATVDLAAAAVGVEAARIAKTLSFSQAERCLLIVAAGDAKVDNSRFKALFHMKARMLTAEEALFRTGYAVGGICPFALDPSIPVYLDVSLRRFPTVFPACGSASSAIELTGDELFLCAKARDWVDVCKGWQEA